ncbi:hypothetical protein CLI64_23130 [Nostoc sp. CENA543]|uniref:hypothetical protein n=1 Tax=Nostoc sp. CENA543 TaxID=1869241 RepID=UPI000CA29522|nr:hypothetical protein [Nostoc sp. CENA543]AUT03065.1 hypothetical protein CLI64_23130 [Nostoc sp. CENA543]
MTNSVEKRKFDDIASWMIPTQATKLPSVLRGVFFMDGNPAPDDCINMYNLEWDEEKYSLLLSVYAPLQWTFDDSIWGWILLWLVQLTKLTYKLQFTDATLQKAQAIPFVFGIKIPIWLINATMEQDENSQNGDIWQRKNIWLSIIPNFANYTLRRIVDEQGNYTPAFQDMLTKVKKECLVIVKD